jgi:hypothetical protein
MSVLAAALLTIVGELTTIVDAKQTVFFTYLVVAVTTYSTLGLSFESLPSKSRLCSSNLEF